MSEQEPIQRKPDEETPQSSYPEQQFPTEIHAEPLLIDQDSLKSDDDFTSLNVPPVAKDEKIKRPIPLPVAQFKEYWSNQGKQKRDFERGKDEFFATEDLLKTLRAGLADAMRFPVNDTSMQRYGNDKIAAVVAFINTFSDGLSSYRKADPHRNVARSEYVLACFQHTVQEVQRNPYTSHVFQEDAVGAFEYVDVYNGILSYGITNEAGNLVAGGMHNLGMEPFGFERGNPTFALYTVHRRGKQAQQNRINSEFGPKSSRYMHTVRTPEGNSLGKDFLRNLSADSFKALSEREGYAQIPLY